MSLLLNGGLIVGWGLSLALSLGTNTHHPPLWALVVLVLVRMQLQTGLFIVAHDAMHGLLFCRHEHLNNTIGALALMLYAGLPFSDCRNQHQRHHQQPGTSHDPDFPNDLECGVVGWYWQFLARYLNQKQMILLLSSWAIALAITSVVSHVSLPLAASRVLLFLTVPLLLSSIQLFVVGTYLPHRQQRSPEHRDHPISLGLPPWLSLLACFHFGYHREHHDNPGLSWFQLPAARLAHVSSRCIAGSGIVKAVI